MTKQNHPLHLSEHRINKFTRPLLRRIKKLQRHHLEECGCLNTLVTILEKLELIEHLVEVIAMEIQRQKQQP